MSAPEPFDVRGPLPTGTTLLEASAGTGKTWTIGALVARYVAEGVVRLDEMLVVTFSRAASQELRERVRAQLVVVERALAGGVGGVPGDPVDPEETGGEPDAVVALLLDAPPEERVRRRERVRDALASFDAATIATTHQFCQLVLRGLGVAGDTDSRARLVEDLDDLLVEVVDDLYVRGFAHEERPAFSRAEALTVARRATRDPQARLEPSGPHEAAEGSPAARRVGFARAVRVELERRKRRLGVLGYDDLLSQLADALEPDGNGRPAPARERMRARWKVVLVDEFQDTDPVQWRVLERAFGSGGDGAGGGDGDSTLVLIGDPKQAIYAFRGGDVVTYLDAAATATTRRTLATNWRSDGALVAAVGALLDGAALGDPEIVVHPVDAHHGERRLAGAPVDAPVRLRHVRREHVTGRAPAPGRASRSGIRMPQLRPHVARDLALDVRALLASGATFAGRRIGPGDVAVLAHTGRQLGHVREALAELGIPSVLAGGGSVFATPAALDWLRLLEAVEQPHRAPRVRSAALTPFLGLGAEELDAGGDVLTDRLADRLRTWSDLLTRRGVAAVLEAADGLAERVLARVDGERHLTDLRHVGEALHQVVLTERLGTVALVAWLREQVVRDEPDGVSERTRRLDSDAAAVQLVTIHGSKGLEWPVVYLPFVADRWTTDPDAPRFHRAVSDDPDGRRSVRALDVGGPTGPAWRASLQRAAADEAGESLRLLYVALTRAQAQVVVWWAASSNAKASPLHRLLLGREPGQAAVPDEHGLVDDDTAAARFAHWAERGAPGAIVVEAGVHATEVPPVPVADEAPLLARRFDRAVDTTWRRTSYSALSAAASAEAPGFVASEPEDVPRADEPDLPVDTGEVAGPADADVPGPGAGWDAPSPMGDLPVGATFGSLVHGVLEHVDPAAPRHGGDVGAELAALVDEQRLRWPVELDAGRHAALVAALEGVLASPLGPLAHGATLGGLARSDRLAEMEFELPLSGGDDPAYVRRQGRPVVLGDLAPLLARHLPPDDPFAGYATQLADPVLGGQELRGYLTGSVDVVLRVPGPDGAPRHLVVDYKTNWLGGPPGDHEARLADYHPDRLAEAMSHSDYPLQALLYAVVLHRFLRLRLPAYDPGVHLGGVVYLYLRGLSGPATPTADGHPAGVFSWRPPTALVEDVSDLLDGRLP